MASPVKKTKIDMDMISCVIFIILSKKQTVIIESNYLSISYCYFATTNLYLFRLNKNNKHHDIYQFSLILSIHKTITGIYYRSKLMFTK